MRSAERAEESPEYGWLREFKSAHGEDLRRRCAAHAIGIGWKKVDGEKTDRLALIFYVQRKKPVGELACEPVPPTVTFMPVDSDDAVVLHTDVVEAEPAKFE